MTALRRAATTAGFTQDYISWPGGRRRLFLLPMLKARFIAPSGRSVITNALVDSGATASFLPPDLAGALELDRKICETSFGAGGAFRTWSADVRVQLVKRMVAKCRPQKVEIRVPFSNICIPYAILGRDSVFWLYDITFRETRQRIDLKPVVC